MIKSSSSDAVCSRSSTKALSMRSLRPTDAVVIDGLLPTREQLLLLVLGEMQTLSQRPIDLAGGDGFGLLTEEAEERFDHAVVGGDGHRRSVSYCAAMGQRFEAAPRCCCGCMAGCT